MGRAGLWPADLVPGDRRTPELILREQAEDLRQKTGGVLTAEVEAGSNGDRLTFDFFVVAPRLDDYHYRLFKVRHKVNPYDPPLEMILSAKRIELARSEDEFIALLRRVFESPETRTLVSDLLGYAARAPAAAE